MAKDEVNVKKAKKEKKEHHKKKEKEKKDKEKKKKEHHKKKEECSDSDDNNKIVPTLDITPYPFKYVAKNKADEIINEYFTRFQIQIIKCKFVKYIVKLYYLNNNTLLKEFVFIVERTNSNTEKNSKRLFNGDKSGYPGKDGNTYNREVTKAIINFITDTVVASVTVETTTPDAVGQSYTVDGITYTIISLSIPGLTNGTVYIQSAVNNGSSTVTIPNTVQFPSDNVYSVISVGVPPNVQVPSSGNGFQGQTWLETININTGLFYISPSSFYDCSGLKTANFPISGSLLQSIGASAFQGSSLSAINNLQDYCYYLTYIGPYAFYNLYLESILLPSPGAGLTVDDYAFYNNDKATNINLGTNLISIGNNAFQLCKIVVSINIPASLQIINASAFYECSILETLTFPSSGSVALTSIGNSAFQGTNILGSLNLSNCSNLTYIGQYAFYFVGPGLIFLPSPAAGLIVDDYAFYSNIYAENINLGTNLISIGVSAFEKCGTIIYLSSITIPASVQIIGASAFYGCTKLETVTFSSSGSLITSIGNSAFQGTSLYYATNLENCSNLTYIGQYAFYDLWLQTILLPSPLAGLTVDSYAFYYNDYATEVQLGSAQTINTEVFYNCSKVSAVYFQSNLSSFNLENLFNNSSLYQVYIDIVGNVVGNINTPFNTLILAGSSYISQIILTSKVTSIYSECQICNDNTPNVSYIQFNSNIFSSDTLGNYVGYVIFNDTFFAAEGGTGITNLATINFNVATIGGYQSGTTIEPVIGGIPSSTNTNVTLSFTNTTTIQPRAFYNCKRINSTTIPSSVTAVGDNAFSECINLTSLVVNTYISNFQSVFQTISNVTGNTSIQSITFNYSNNIPDNSCQNFSELETLVLDNVTSIGTTAFYDCVALTSVSIPSTVTSVGDNAFSQCISLKTLVVDTYISNFASVFQTTLNITGNTSIQSITFLGYSTPSGVSESIPENACQNFSALETLVLYNGLIGIGSYAFNGCTLLTYADIPSSVLSDNFGTFVFAECGSLTQVILPNSNTFTNIPDYTFSDCSKLSSINASTLTYITSYGQNTFSNCGFTGFTVSDSVTSIGISVFEGSDNLSSITLSTNITNIPSSAFYGCLNLANVTNLSAQVTYIGQYAFSNSGIRYISIPGSPNSSLSGIDEYAFSGCSNLTAINVPYLLGINNSGTFVPSILEGVFSGSGFRNIDFTNSTTTNSVFTPEISTINANAFFKCVDLTSINLCNFTDTNVLTNYVSDLGVAAFGNCEQLNTVTLFSGINGTTSLININNGNDAFTGCTSLQNSSFPGIIITDYGVDEPPPPDSEDEVAYYFTTNGFNNTIYLPVIYNGNGNTGGTAPLSANYQQGFTVTVSGNTGNLVNTGFTFNGWTTLPSGGTYYAPNDTFTIGIYTVLYADWV